MQNAVISVRVDEYTKKQFDRFCFNIGTTTSDLIKMFMRKVNFTLKVPFELSMPKETPQMANLRLYKELREEASGIAEKMGIKDIDDVVRLIKEDREERKRGKQTDR
jgi:addiction module RelB/DinJ family antitoxin